MNRRDGQERHVRFLFGGTEQWDADLWKATDDRVRGGSSISHLKIHNDIARFSGNLDTTTLGGAGFASQRTKGELDLDLSKASGLVLQISHTDGKRYLITLKDEIPGRRDDGREMSGITWEAEIDTSKSKLAHGHTSDIHVPWNAFKATYRGRPKDDAKPLNLKSIKRVSLMMRSFFGQQEGDFSLDIRSIGAVCPSGSASPTAAIDTRVNMMADHDDCDIADEKAHAILNQRKPAKQGWWSRMLCCL